MQQQAASSSVRTEPNRRFMDSERSRWALAALLLTMLAGVRAAFPTERDQYWSARAGMETLAGSPLVRQDAWSWSSEGVWYPNSPVWNVVLGLGWQALGFWGLFWVAFASISLLLGLSLYAARAAGARALPAFIAFAPVVLAASSALSPRATVFVQALLLGAALFAWWWGGFAARLNGLVRTAVVALAGVSLSLVGNWVHLSFMLLAGVIAVMWGVAWWLSPGLRNLHRFVLTAAGALGLLAGCIFSPYGIALTLERSALVGAICRGIIIEWTSVPGAALLGEWRWIPVCAFAVLVAVGSGAWAVRLVMRRGRFDPRARLVVPLAVFAVPVTLAGVGAIRFLVLGMLAILPIAAAAATTLVDRLHERQRAGVGWSHPKLREYTSGRFWSVVLVGITVVLMPLTAFVMTKGAQPTEAMLAESLPAGCSLLSDPGAAGPVILMRPDIDVWIDGRADFYGRDHLLEAKRIYAAADPLPTEADCVIFPVGSDPAMALAGVLDGRAGWERIATAGGYGAWARRE